MAQKLWDLSQQAEEKNSQSAPTQGKFSPSDKNKKKNQNPKVWANAVPGCSSQAMLEINISQFHGDSLNCLLPQP